MLATEQKTAIDGVMKVLGDAKGGRNRLLCEAFLDLPDRTAWKSYYDIIPNPRALHQIQDNLDRGVYKNPSVVYEDLTLVFDNAIYFNEEESTIYKDAVALKNLLEHAWSLNSDLGQHHSAANTNDQSKTASSGGGSIPSSDKQSAELLNTSFPDEVSFAIAPENNWESLQPRDKQGDELIKKLERSLSRWKGPGLEGWLTVDGSSLKDPYKVYTEILIQLKVQKDRNNEYRLADSIERVSESIVLPDLYFQSPISLALIQSRIDARGYPGPKDFDMDLHRLFEKSRRWFEEGSREYGQVLTLQRLYHALTSPFSTINAAGPTSVVSNFSSIVAGPGNAKPLHSAASTSEDGVTTYRIQNKEREFIQEITFKGVCYRPGDYVHLMNPDDAARPIIGQIFKVYIPDNAAPGQKSLTACWYFRPEQTHHPAQRTFWDREVFKTGHFADHVMEDIIEKIGCQFMTRHVRGRPKPPHWYPGWPLYVCDSRYNDRDRTFVRIKNWNSCIPDELRKADFMPIQPFERIVMPKRRESPFLRGIRGPGGLGEDTEVQRKSKRAAALAARHARQVSGEDAVPAQVNASLVYNAVSRPVGLVRDALGRKPGISRSLTDAVGGAAVLGGNPIVEVLPTHTTKYFDRDPDSRELLWFSGPPMYGSTQSAPKLHHSLEYLSFLAKKRMHPSRVHQEDSGPSSDDGDSMQGNKRAKADSAPACAQTDPPLTMRSAIIESMRSWAG